MADGIIIPAKTVRANASSAAIYLPKKYIGHTFKVILLPETEQDRDLFKKNNKLVESKAKIVQMEKQMKALQNRMEKEKAKEETPITHINTLNEVEPENAY